MNSLGQSKSKSKKVLKFVWILGSISSLYFVPWLLVKAWILPLPNTIQEQLDASLSYGFDGVLVYVQQEGKPPQYYASGWKNRENKIPADPKSLFKIASISKLYDAVAVSKLVSEELLSLDKTLAEYLPELNGRIENADKITLRHMVQHKSGIPNFTDSTPNFWGNPTKTYEESIALILDKPANFEPGQDYAYCNTNYLLINKIMDEVLGYPNFEFIRNKILQPLQLNHTYGSLDEVALEDVMSGYHIGYPNDLKADDHGMLATAEDVGIFIRALNDGSLFEPGEQQIYSSIYKYEHAGWIPGYQSFASYDIELNTVFVEFYSTTDSELYNWNLSEVFNSRIVKVFKKEH
ncbi:MAG: serine hydrolase domain-containing protein [Flavicella sp.]